MTSRRQSSADVTPQHVCGGHGDDDDVNEERGNGNVFDQVQLLFTDAHLRKQRAQTGKACCEVLQSACERVTQARCGSRDRYKNAD